MQINGSLHTMLQNNRMTLLKRKDDDMSFKNCYKTLKKKPLLFFTLIDGYCGSKIFSESFFQKLNYRAVVGKWANFKNPKLYREKIVWLNIYDKNPLYSVMQDKYLAKFYIASILGQEYVIPLLGVWDKFEDIDFELLPEKFVLKTNHDSGGVWIIKDKKNINYKRIKKEIKRHLFRVPRGYAYKRIIPRIIAEEYMENKTGEGISDYKFNCFNGEIKMILVCSQRYTESFTRDYFDRNWNRIDLSNIKNTSSNTVGKPKHFGKMIEIAEKLSFGLPFVRVDFYEINEKIYFGELTLFPGEFYFMNEKSDIMLGAWLELPDKKSLKKENAEHRKQSGKSQ